MSSANDKINMKVGRLAISGHHENFVDLTIITGIQLEDPSEEKKPSFNNLLQQMKPKVMEK